LAERDQPTLAVRQVAEHARIEWGRIEDPHRDTSDHAGHRQVHSVPGPRSPHLSRDLGFVSGRTGEDWRRSAGQAPATCQQHAPVNRGQWRAIVTMVRRRSGAVCWVVRLIPKLRTRVRFPSSARFTKAQVRERLLRTWAFVVPGSFRVSEGRGSGRPDGRVPGSRSCGAGMPIRVIPSGDLTPRVCTTCGQLCPHLGIRWSGR
jgi:hypothetical protein